MQSIALSSVGNVLRAQARVFAVLIAVSLLLAGKAHATYNLNLNCPGPGQTLENLRQPPGPVTDGRVAASSEFARPVSIPLAFASGDLRVAPAASDLSTYGIFKIEQTIDFNVLDRVLFYPERSRVVLLGHHDPAYSGPQIPYLQHLAALLDRPDPEFTLNWTPESERKVDAFLARMDNLNELKRLVNEAGTIWNGAGGVTTSGKWLLQYLGLKPDANGEFPGLDRVDLNAAMLVKADDRRAACVLLAMHQLNENAKAGADTRRFYFHSFFAALGIEAEGVALNQQMQNGKLSEAKYERRVYGLMCSRLDQVFHLSGAVANAFEDALRRHRSIVGGGPCFDEYNRHLREITKRAMDRALGQTRAIIVPVEGIASLVGTRPEVMPVFTNVDPHSQLARLMLEADYLGKKLINLPDFESRDILGYQSEFIFNRDNPTRRVGANATQHLWFSIDNVDANQSTDGHVLDLKSASIRVNIRQYDRNNRDLPRIVGGYGDKLTALYPAFARRYPVLHELQEAAKLAAAAKWIHQRRPQFRLPKEGRQTWTAPDRLPGVIYMTLALVQSRTSANTVLSAVGGVSLVVPYKVNGTIAEIGDNLGANVVDLRPPPALQLGADKLNQIFDQGGKKSALLPLPLAWSKKSGADKNSGGIAVSVSQTSKDTVVVGRGGADALVPKAQLDGAIATARDEVKAAQDGREKAVRLVQLAYLLQDRGDTDEAIKVLNDTRAVDPIAALVIAQHEAMRGNTSAARKNLEVYVAREPGNMRARELLTELRNKQSQPATNKGQVPGRLAPFEYPKFTSLWDDAAIDACRRDVLCGKKVPDIKFHKADLSEPLLLPDSVEQLLKINPAVASELEPMLKAQEEKISAIDALKSSGGSADALQKANSELNEVKAKLKKKVDEIKVKYKLDETPEPSRPGTEQGAAPLPSNSEIKE